jgi:pilus assembly protein CpaB
MTVAIFALLLGLAGAYTVRQVLQQPQAAAAAAAVAPRNQTIAFASTELVPGKTLSMGDIVMMSLSPDQLKRRKVPADAMTSSQFLVGRILKNALKKGEPFLTTDLYAEGLGPTVGERLKPGFRAVTIPVSDLAAVSGFATPGSMVDVLFRAEEREGVSEATFTLVEGVEVLAYGQSTVPGSRSGRAATSAGMVTLAVTPKQAASLQLATGHGEMMLTVRNPQDVVSGDAPSRMTLDQLLGVQYSGPRRMEIYRGGSRQTLLFQNNQVVGDDLTSTPRTQAPVVAQPNGGVDVTAADRPNVGN